MEKENKKQPIFVHPYAYAILKAKQMKGNHDLKKSEQTIQKIDNTRLAICEFAEKATNGNISAQKTFNDFETIDKIYAPRAKKLEPLKASALKIKKDKSLTKEQKKEQIKTIKQEAQKIYNDFRVQAFLATSMASVKLYDTQSDKKLLDKSGKISTKGILLLTVALAGVGVGAYFAINGLGGSKSADAADYTGSLVTPQNLNVDSSKSFSPEIDSSSVEFKELVNSSDYINAVSQIVEQKQTALENLTTQTNNEIMAKYDLINKLSDYSGFDEKEIGLILSYNGLQRAKGSDGLPTESLAAFYTRIKNFYESKNPDLMYENINHEYQSKVPQEVLDIYANNNINLDFEKDEAIRSYLSNNIRHYQTTGEGGEWVDHYEFDPNIPEGTTMKFLEEYYFDYFYDNRTTISIVHGDIIRSELYQEYQKTLLNISSINNTLENHYAELDPSYAKQIKQAVLDIDTIQENYLIKSNEIENSMNLEVADLQKTSLGLDETFGSLFSNNLGDVMDKTSAVRCFVDQILSGASELKANAESVALDTIDTLSRSF